MTCLKDPLVLENLEALNFAPSHRLRYQLLPHFARPAGLKAS
jgi:hypothetical protein